MKVDWIQKIRSKLLNNIYIYILLILVTWKYLKGSTYQNEFETW